jgi:hypothetical protein
VQDSYCPRKRQYDADGNSDIEVRPHPKGSPFSAR